MTKIYTKTGDTGTSILLGGGAPETKNSIKFEVWGDVDELNSSLGFCHTTKDKRIRKSIIEIQFTLLNLGSLLAGAKGEYTTDQYWTGKTEELEALIDMYDKKNDTLRNFIVPGGCKNSLYFHLARTICRRTERHMVTFTQQMQNYQFILKYINRLSDLLFVLARYENKKAGYKDVAWNIRQ